MVIRLKSTIDKRNYELLVQLCIFRGDNLNYKTINLVKVEKYINLFRIFRLKKILQKRIFLSLLEIN